MMSHKSPRIAEMIRAFHGHDLDPHYLGFFACFNQGKYYEAHDVLEELWLGCRKEPHGDFYKALIQLAGAFVHLQKKRLRPAGSLFRLSSGYLKRFLPRQDDLDVAGVLELITHWHGLLEEGNYELNPLENHPAPRLAPDSFPGV